jgi:hypothetical protein
MEALSCTPLYNVLIELGSEAKLPRRFSEKALLGIILAFTLSGNWQFMPRLHYERPALKEELA